MKRRAREETLPIPQIYCEEIVKTRVEHPSLLTGLFFPTLQSIDSSLYRWRAENYPNLPKTLADLDIPEEWKSSKHQKPFLLIDEKYGEERLLLFASDCSLEFLSSSIHWHSDGTFSVRPLLFAQLHIIFGYSNGYTIPCVYCLTSKKDELVYARVVQHIVALGRRLNLQFQPQRLTCDFEKGVMNIFSSAFPSIKMNGCFFHYSQALWQKIQELGLCRYFVRTKENSTSIKEDERKKAEDWFFAAVGLALIPPSIVSSTWVESMDELTPDQRAATKFNDYLVSTYVDQPSCRYTIDIWNVNDAIVRNLPRTNNSAEGYNNRLGNVFPTHPHIYRFIELLRVEHVFQQHKAEESFVQLRKPEKNTTTIDAQLALLLHRHANEEISNLQLAISCGKAVKTRFIKK